MPDSTCPPKSHSRRSVFYVAQFLIACLVTLVLLEVVLHLAPTFNLKHDVLELRSWSPIFHHTLLPNVSNGRVVWGETDTVYHTNSLGMRDASARTITPDMTNMVLVLGDSFTEGMGVPYEQTFTALLEQRLNHVVLNCGVSSYAPSLEYLRLKNLIAKGIKPKVVLLMLDVSDVQDEIAYMEDAAVFDAQGDLVGMNRKGSFWPWLYTHFRLYYNYYHLREMHRARSGPQAGKVANELPQDSRDAKPDRWLPENQRKERGLWTHDQEVYNRWGKRGLQYAKQYILRIAQTVEANGGRFVLCIYPWPDQLVAPEAIRNLSALWGQFAQVNNIAFVDMAKPLGALPDWQTYLIPGDIHWNEKGHAWVADLLFSTIADSLSLPQPAGP